MNMLFHFPKRMKKIIDRIRLILYLLVVCILCLNIKVCAQQYGRLKIDLVKSFYDSACAETILAGKKILKKHPDKATADDYYLLARCYARLGDTINAFQILNEAVKKGFSQISRLKKASDFVLLQNTEEWNELLNRVELSKQQKDSRIKFPDIAFQLKEMYNKDQDIRLQMNKLFEKGIAKIPDSLGKLQLRNDSVNLIALKKMVSEIGWPGISLVGEEGNNTAFLLAQHADRDTAAQSSFLILLRASVYKNDSDPRYLALLEDRVLRHQNKPQQYGTQAWINPVTKKFEIAPIEDEKNVDVRRILMGLTPLKVYKKEMGIVD